MALSHRYLRLGLATTVGLASLMILGLTPAQQPRNSVATQASRNGPDLTKASISELEKASHRLGSADAPITIVEFADFCCPSCAKTHLKLTHLVANSKSKISLIYHQFPLTHVHEQALHASTLSEQLDDKDFWDFAAKVYLSGKKLSKQDFDGIYSACHGKRARTEMAAAEKVAADLKVSHEYGVNSTPTCLIFIGDNPVATSGPNFKEVLQRPEFAKILQQSAP